jgi:hydrogenase 3 maturation protease
MDQQCTDQLRDFIDGRVCLLGIGNRYWHDDGVGSYLAEALKPCQGMDVIDAGFIPENHLETVAGKNPKTILMVDATDFGGRPGQVRLLYPDKVAHSGLSTHAGSLRMLAEYLEARTQASIALLAIQPADTSAGEGLSEEVTRTFKSLLKILPAVCGNTTNKKNRDQY